MKCERKCFPLLMCAWSVLVCESNSLNVTIFSNTEKFSQPGAKISILCGCQPVCTSFVWYVIGVVGAIADAESGFPRVYQYTQNISVAFNDTSHRSSLIVTVWEQIYGKLFQCHGKIGNADYVLAPNSVQITKPVVPYNLEFDPSVFVHQADKKTTITCSAEGTPAPNLTFTADPALNSPPSIGPDQVIQSRRKTTKTLTYTPRRSDNGKQIRCTAHNLAVTDGQTSPSKSAMLNITSAPENITFDSPADFVDQNADTDLSVTCIAYCNPDCTYSWTKIGDSRFSKRNNKVFTLTGIQKHDAGRYECKAINNYGNMSKTLRLSVNYIQASLSIIPSSPVTEGQDVTLDCNVDSHPGNYSIRWTHDLERVVRNGQSNVLS